MHIHHDSGIVPTLVSSSSPFPSDARDGITCMLSGLGCCGDLCRRCTSFVAVVTLNHCIMTPKTCCDMSQGHVSRLQHPFPTHVGLQKSHLCDLESSESYS